MVLLGMGTQDQARNFHIRGHRGTPSALLRLAKRWLPVTAALYPSVTQKRVDGGPSGEGAPCGVMAGQAAGTPRRRSGLFPFGGCG